LLHRVLFPPTSLYLLEAVFLIRVSLEVSCSLNGDPIVKSWQQSIMLPMNILVAGKLFRDDSVALP
jgi:hypothetical protein